MSGVSRGLPDPPELLARVLEHRGWSVRTGQLDMVESIDDAFDIDDPVRDASINAPTGTGKSLGYIVASLPSDQRIVISTSTKALQDQIVRHELPRLGGDLKEMFDFDLKFAVLKGKSNYLCMESAKAFIGISDSGEVEEGLFDFDPEDLRDDHVQLIRAMIDRTEKAMEERDTTNLDCGDLLFTLPGMIRQSIDATKKCTDKSRKWYREVEDGDDYGLLEEEILFDIDDDDGGVKRIPFTIDEILDDARCPYRMAYALALQADVVVMNTSLLAAELLKSQQVGDMSPQQITGTGIIVVDEAHHLIRILTQAMSQQVDFDNLYGSGDTLFKKLAKRRPDMESRLQGGKRILEQANDDLVGIIDNSKASKRRGDISARLLRLKDDLVQLTLGVDVSNAAKVELSERDKKVIASITDQIDEDILQPIVTAANSIIMMAGPKDPTYDASFAGGNEDEWLAIDLVPLDLSFFRNKLAEINLKKNVYIGQSGLRRTTEQVSSLILCSGTITGEVSRVIGVWDGVHHNVESPFDPVRQRICVPEHLPEPSNQLWEEEAWTVAKSAIEAAGGRTLFLTTSHARMNAFKDRALEELKFNVLYQNNGMSRSDLLHQFSEDETSVLFGTTSFWEGVDIPGPALSLVVIDKIMFPIPNDPVFEARSKWAEKHDEDPFMKVHVDHASVMMAQGIGRLMRSEPDMGGILVLDPRIATKRYGPAIMNIIPAETPFCTQEEHLVEWLEWVIENQGAEDVPDPNPEYWRPLRQKRKKRRARA